MLSEVSKVKRVRGIALTYTCTHINIRPKSTELLYNREKVVLGVQELNNKLIKVQAVQHNHNNKLNLFTFSPLNYLSPYAHSHSDRIIIIGLYASPIKLCSPNLYGLERHDNKLHRISIFLIPISYNNPSK